MKTTTKSKFVVANPAPTPDIDPPVDVGGGVSTRIEADRFLADFADGKTTATRRGYLADLRSFAQFAANGDAVEAVRLLLGSGPGAANRLVHTYRSHLLELRRAPNTINRHLTSLGSLVSFANWIGLVPWRLLTKRLRARRIKDVRGPGTNGVRCMLAASSTYPNLIKGLRDTAITWLLYGCGLRVSELASLDLEHVDKRQQRLWVLGKGEHERVPVPVPPPAWGALIDWLAVRHPNPGPLFHRLDAPHRGKSLTRRGVFKLVRLHAAHCGFVTRPHGLRHAAIGAALNHGRSLRDVMAFSRHRSANSVAAYDDALSHEVGGAVAAIVAADVAKQPA